MYRMLIINPGSTSTKIAVYEDLNQVFSENIKHTAQEIVPFPKIIDQLSFRKEAIEETLTAKGVKLETFHAVVGRGGLLKPIAGGTYEISGDMLYDLRIGYQGQHASNLGGILAHELAQPYGLPSYIVDPVVIDEMEDVARITGLKGLERKSIFHALNQKAVARRYAKENGKNYKELNLIVAHMGGGVSVGAHRCGKVIDVNNGLDGDGPFSPERSGGLPAGDLVNLCFSGGYTKEEIKKKLSGKGGFVSYLNTADALEVIKMIEGGNKTAQLIFEAMSYQVGKEIGQYAAVLKGKVDAIILTGGLAYSQMNVDKIKEMVSFIAPVVVYAGEDEMLSLAEGGYRVLAGEEKAKTY